MSGVARFDVYFMFFSPSYRPISQEIYVSSFASPTPIRNVRSRVVRGLRHLVPPRSTLALIQLPTYNDLLDLSQTISTKRPTKVVAYLATKAPKESKLPNNLTGESYFVTILGTDSSSLAPDLNRDYSPMDNVWPAALRASPNQSTEWSEFKPTRDHLILNHIVLMEQLQGPALNLKNKVFTKRRLLPMTIAALASTILGPQTYNLFETTDAESDMQIERHPHLEEDADLQAEGLLYQSVLEDFTAKNRLRCSDRAFLTSSVLYPFIRFLQRAGDVFVPKWCSDSNVETVLPVLMDNTPCLYTLNVALSLWRNDCPKFLLATSTVEGPTLYELIFQGASVQSLVNWVDYAGEKSAPDFTLPLLYVDIYLHLDIYLMREDNDRFLYTRIGSWDLNEPVGLIRLLKCLLYFSETPQVSHRGLDRAWESCASQQTPSYEISGGRIVESIDALRFRFRSALRARRPQRPITRTGLRLYPSHDDPGGIFRVKMGKVTVAIKKVQVRSQEHRILQQIEYLRDNQGIFIVLPFLQHISDIFTHPNAVSMVLRLSVELTSGLQFLHDNHIAHLDIKPDNLALSTEWVLQIIDFGASVFILDEDDLMVGKCGTRGFMAPEIVKKLPFSPVRADRFSCGRVFLQFAKINKEHQGLVSFASLLTSENPLERPALTNWASMV